MSEEVEVSREELLDIIAEDITSDDEIQDR